MIRGRCGCAAGALLRALVIALLVPVGVAGAHGGGPEHALQRTRLCLDPAAVQVEARGEGVAEGTGAVLAERLERGLTGALSRTGVPFRHVSDADARGCDAVRQRLEIERWESERGMTVGYDLVLEVLTDADQPPVFFVGARAAFLEAEATSPYLVLLPRFADAAARDLALSWWEDNPVRTGPPRWAAPALGGTLALLVAAAAALLARRWQRRSPLER